MKLRNKKTGEIVEYDNIFFYKLTCKGNEKFKPNVQTISELNEYWEDYKEPKSSALDLTILTLTNFIENEPDENKVDLEDCKRLLEKLKAWKRLKDKGFRFTGHFLGTEGLNIHYECDMKNDISDDLDLLFSGEDD